MLRPQRWSGVKPGVLTPVGEPDSDDQRSCGQQRQQLKTLRPSMSTRRRGVRADRTGDKTVHLVNRRRVTAHGGGPAREGVLGNDDRAALIGVDHEVDAPARNCAKFDRLAVGSARPMRSRSTSSQQAGHEPGGSARALIEVTAPVATRRSPSSTTGAMRQRSGSPSVVAITRGRSLRVRLCSRGRCSPASDVDALTGRVFAPCGCR